MKTVGLSALVLACAALGASAQELKPPRLSFAQIDWGAAVATLTEVDALRPAALAAKPRLSGRGNWPVLVRLNSVMSRHFPAVGISPVPVLMPFDVGALLRDQSPPREADANSGSYTIKFFYPGQAGYDAALAIRPADMPELADGPYTEPIQVQISGSSLLYELDPPVPAEGSPVHALEQELPGVRRLLLEHHVRYTFERFGAPYVVSIACHDAGTPRYKMPTCRAADAVAQHLLRRLRVVGGTPRVIRAAAPLPVERPVPVSQTFGYYGPGQLQSGTSWHGQGGRVDYTVYSQIRFPLAQPPVFAHSELFQRGTRARSPNEDEDGAFSHPSAWRDNFCERRGFPVGQCPSGIGHQGQDLRAPCKPSAGSDRCRHGDVVAVRDGMILRSPRQEAAYLFVNSANEHIRFRYLHMSPRQMDADHLFSGRRVHEGEVIGEISNYSMRTAGTSYHLHFDVQVPTRNGWVFVNPYMTLVAAYERLIGARGTEFADPKLVASADPTITHSVAVEPHVESATSQPLSAAPPRPAPPAVTAPVSKRVKTNPKARAKAHAKSRAKSHARKRYAHR